jgi:CO/xanthine dehydrogenase Mo-binding subunit
MRHGRVRVRRMLAVCAAGRILNPKTARSQVIGAMTMGVGGALMEELAVDKRHGFFVNHDLAGYEVPVHADIPHQEVIFLDETDPMSSPMKAKGVGELGLCGVAAAIANAIYNATGVRGCATTRTPSRSTSTSTGCRCPPTFDTRPDGHGSLACSDRRQAGTVQFWRLGAGHPVPVSGA